MSQTMSRLLALPDELILLIFNQMSFNDQRAFIQTNKRLRDKLTPEFFERIGPIDFNFLAHSGAELAGLRRFGHKLKNLVIHNIGWSIYGCQEESKVQEILSLFRDHEISTLIFTKNSSLRALTKGGSASSYKILEKALMRGPLPRIVVLPQCMERGGEPSEFCAIVHTSTRMAPNINSPGRNTTFYLRSEAHLDTFGEVVQFHHSEVSRISLFYEDHRYFSERATLLKFEEWMRSPAFKSLRSIEFHWLDLSRIIDIELPSSIESLGFFDNPISDKAGRSGQEDVMKRFISTKKNVPDGRPVLKQFVHRQTTDSGRRGLCTVPGTVLASFCQQMSDMHVQVIQQDLEFHGNLAEFASTTLEYACHRHGIEDRPYDDIKSFMKVSRNLVGFGMNFQPILFTSPLTEVGDDFRQEADRLADALSPAKGLHTLLLYTPDLEAQFSNPAEDNVRTALGYLATKLACHDVSLKTIFVINRGILCSWYMLLPAWCFRVTTEVNYQGDVVHVASAPTIEHSEQEFEVLRKLGGDNLVTFNDHERHGLGALYFGHDEMKAYQRRRNERLGLENKMREMKYRTAVELMLTTRTPETDGFPAQRKPRITE